MRKPCVCSAVIIRWAVGLVRPVASAIVVNERAPFSTASSTSTARSSTPTPVEGEGRLAAVAPSRMSPSSWMFVGIVVPLRLVLGSPLTPPCGGGRLIQWCPLFETGFHYVDTAYQRPPGRMTAAEPSGPGAPDRPRRQKSGVEPMPKTLAEKIWDQHIVRSADGEPDLLYI